MTTVLFGHRGVGKTTLLRSLPGQTFDLDEEITKRSGRTPSEWLEKSEGDFRATERAVFAELLNEGESVIALGAGFEGPLPSEVHKIWLRRVSDSNGRSFLNRPRLNKDVSPWAEYMERFPAREKRFASWADEELFLPEGDSTPFFFNPPFEIPGALTLLPENFRAWRKFVERRCPQLWEVREDLLSPEQIRLSLESLPRDLVLFSIRNHSFAPPPNTKLDWALELGQPKQPYFSVSLHNRETLLEDSLARFENIEAQIHKLAIEIHSYEELLQGHRWWLQDPQRRAFLPRSKNGRWRGYRSLFGPKMPLHFIREGSGSSLDQPFLWQAMLQPKLKKHFAAVLGDPVEHSRSPREHNDFFKETPFVSFSVQEQEFAQALPVLRELGLRYAAVTSPLKKLAQNFADQVSAEAKTTGAANTLLLSETVLAHNTDLLALKKWREDLSVYNSVWIWGGGGLKETLQSLWPQAHQVSARTGTAKGSPPDLVLWAVGRSREFQFPQSKVRPQLVADLNYGDDSPGLEWAVAAGLPYQSGLKMFKLQAQFQREFWAKEVL